MKIVKSFKISSLLIGGISETIENEAKEQKDGFLPMLVYQKVQQDKQCNRTEA